MAPKRWGVELNMQFMEAYRSKECLWYRFDPLYKNQNARLKALQEIRDEMNLKDFDVEDVKLKIKSFRGTYKLELEKQKKSEDSGDLYVPKIKWIPIMEEIMSRAKLKTRNHGDLKLANLKQEDDDCLSESVEPEYDSLFPEETVLIPQLVVENAMENSPSQEQDAYHPPSKKFKASSYAEQIASTACREQHGNSINSIPAQQDEFDIFANLVAVRLKNLSPQQAIAAEMKILSVLNDCRMEDLNAQAPLL